MPTTTNYGWTTPADTDLVKDGASAIRTLGNSIDSTLKTQIDAQIPDSIVDAKGDLITATADNTPARLAVGTNGQVLTVDSTTSTGLKWATSSSGSLTQLATGSISGVNTLTISSISTSYKHLLLILNDLTCASNFFLGIRVNGLTGNVYGSSASSAANNNMSGSQFAAFEEQFANTTNNKYVISFPDYSDTTAWKTMTAEFAGELAANYGTRFYYGGVQETSAITSITIRERLSVNFTGGTYILYGVN